MHNRAPIISGDDPRAYEFTPHAQSQVLLEIRGRSNETFTRKQIAEICGVTPQTIANQERLALARGAGEWASAGGRKLGQHGPGLVQFRRAGRALKNCSPSNRPSEFDPALRRTWRKRTAAETCTTQDEAWPVATAGGGLGEATPRCHGNAMPINPNVIGAAAPISHAELPTPRDLGELGLVSLPPFDPLDSDSGRQGRVGRPLLDAILEQEADVA